MPCDTVTHKKHLRLNLMSTDLTYRKSLEEVSFVNLMGIWVEDVKLMLCDLLVRYDDPFSSRGGVGLS
jgi:hypothetical protein